MLTGCAATQIINQWSNPDYTAATFKRVLVIGVSKQTSIRRTFEDEFVAQSSLTMLRISSAIQFRNRCANRLPDPRDRRLDAMVKKLRSTLAQCQRPSMLWPPNSVLARFREFMRLRIVRRSYPFSFR